jgi:hypothetical protein
VSPAASGLPGSGNTVTTCRWDTPAPARRTSGLSTISNASAAALAFFHHQTFVYDKVKLPPAAEIC